METPRETPLVKNEVVKVVGQLHGRQDSPIGWLETYFDYHKTNLKMIRSKLDRFVMIRRNKGKLEGIISILIDETSCAGIDLFVVTEKEACRQFTLKGVQIIGE